MPLKHSTGVGNLWGPAGGRLLPVLHLGSQGLGEGVDGVLAEDLDLGVRVRAVEGGYQGLIQPVCQAKEHPLGLDGS